LLVAIEAGTEARAREIQRQIEIGVGRIVVQRRVEAGRQIGVDERIEGSGDPAR
jgi:hypothetical protein